MLAEGTLELDIMQNWRQFWSEITVGAEGHVELPPLLDCRAASDVIAFNTS